MDKYFEKTNKELDDRIQKLHSNKESLKVLENNFNALKDKYKDLRVDEFYYKKYLVADLDNNPNKRLYLVTKYNSIGYFFKVKEKDLNCYVYSSVPYRKINIVNLFPNYGRQDPKIEINSDYIKLANDFKRKSLIKNTENFILGLLDRFKNDRDYKISIKNKTDNPKIQQFIDNLIFA